MAWGVFEVRDTAGNITAMHVAPCDSTGRILAPHTLEETCQLIGRIDRDGRVPVYVHEREQ